ncbi:MAG: DUF362 domain-containing protein [Candidatus Aminicenantales bacterium]
MNHTIIPGLNRREFIKMSFVGLTSLPHFETRLFSQEKRKTPIALFKTSDRKQGVREILRLLSFPSPQGKRLLIKPNFNTADPAPGSTHNDTLAQLILEMRARGADQITVGERSGPPPTHKVMEEKGIFALAREMDFAVINFEELPEEEWVHFNPPGSHWPEGFSLAKPAVDAEYLVSTCCLKTHQFGGVFTMSMKLSVGLTPKKYMRELHRSPDMRKMIAELNFGYRPQVIVLDGVDAFVDGGPSTGKNVNANVFIGGTDRIAVDAVGLAVLKDLGSNEAIMKTKIFEQEQIRRAVELGLGISHPEQIEIVTPDPPSQIYAKTIREILNEG